MTERQKHWRTPPAALAARPTHPASEREYVAPETPYEAIQAVTQAAEECEPLTIEGLKEVVAEIRREEGVGPHYGIGQLGFGGEIGSYPSIPVVRSPLVPKGKAFVIGPNASMILIEEGATIRKLKWYEIAIMYVKRWAYIAAFGWSGAPFAPRRALGRMTIR